MKVKQGSVIISDVDMIIDHEDVKIIHVDCASKYFEASGYPGYGNEAPELHLWAGERTLKSRAVTEPSKIIFEELPGWQMIISGGKYSRRVVLYKDPGVKDMLYTREGS